MTLRKKMISGFASLALIGVILGIVGLVAIRMISSLSQQERFLFDSSSGIRNVLEAHYTWRQGLTESVLNSSEFQGSLDPNTCALGKWRNSDDAKNTTDPELLSLLSQIDQPHSFIHNEARVLVDEIAAGKDDEAKRLLNDQLLPKTKETIEILTKMNDRVNFLILENSNEIVRLQNLMTIIIIGLIFLAIAASILLAMSITNGIMKPIRMMTSAAEKIAIGDTDVNVHYNVNDEIGRLANAFQKMIDSTNNQIVALELLAGGDFTVSITPRSESDRMSNVMVDMMGNLSNMFAEIKRSTEQVSNGSAQMADGAQMLAQGATEQAATISELSQSLADITEKTKANTFKSAQAAQLAEKILANAQKGSRQMGGMTEAVKEINAASQSINKVIKVIDDIAFQTNILALNAAVEAARAGQHGKGFAVVADEVRNLAAKSAEAAKDTNVLIANSIEKAELGQRIADDTAASLDEIVIGINESSKIVLEISRSSEQQTTEMDQIHIGVDQVAQVVHQNSATAEESAAASQEISSQAENLKQLVSKFKIKEDTSNFNSFESDSDNQFGMSLDGDFYS